MSENQGPKARFRGIRKVASSNLSFRRLEEPSFEAKLQSLTELSYLLACSQQMEAKTKWKREALERSLKVGFESRFKGLQPLKAFESPFK